MTDGGKGSKPRPYSVTQDQFAQNWDMIFGKRNEKNSTQTNQTIQSFEQGHLDVPGLQQGTNSRRY